MSRAVFWILMLAVFCLLCSRIAESRPRSAADQLAELLARVGAHEGAIQNLRDLDLFWQVVQNNADTTPKRLEFLRAHCPQVAGMRECRENCWAVGIASATLPASVAAGEVGYWKKVVLPRYESIAKRAARLVRGMHYDKPCEGRPTTWGGPMDHDRALRIGMVQNVCRGTLNEGWHWPEGKAPR